MWLRKCIPCCNEIRGGIKHGFDDLRVYHDLRVWLVALWGCERKEWSPKPNSASVFVAWGHPDAFLWAPTPSKRGGHLPANGAARGARLSIGALCRKDQTTDVVYDFVYGVDVAATKKTRQEEKQAR